ncbi:MAG: ABC transporter ATP-binding protein [Halobacteriota archaeon]
MTTDSMIRFDGVHKQFGETTAVDDVSFTVQEGEFLALLGPSGSGKSTTLRMLAGFEEPTSGRIELEGMDLTGVPPHKRDTSMVFQNYALFPHMTVAENVAFGLKRHDVAADERERRVHETLELVDLADLKDRRPGTLSGGQQQRVATARALAIEPKVLLMDEPLGALDKKLRDRIKVDFARLQKRLGITTVYVTHNQDEALTMADRIAVMNEGRIEQIGTPSEVYERPKSRFVSDFIGDANFIEGDLEATGDRVVLQAHGRDLNVDAAGVPSNASLAFVRPERMRIVADAGAADNVLTGVVEQKLFVGSKTQYFVSVDGVEYVAEGDPAVPTDEGDSVLLGWAREDTHLVEV